MRHLNRGRKLNRTSSHRKALFKNLVLALVRHGRIRTTDAKAKELRRYADRMVTLGQQRDLAARRRAFDFMQSHQAVKKLFDEIAPRFKDRNGGYTRIVRTGWRSGDGADTAVLELVGTQVLQQRAELRAKRAERRKKAAEEAAAQQPGLPPEPEE